MKVKLNYICLLSLFLIGYNVCLNTVYAQTKKEESSASFKQHLQSNTSNDKFKQKFNYTLKLYLNKKISDKIFLKYLIQSYKTILKNPNLRQYTSDILKYQAEILHKRAFFILASKISTNLLKKIQDPFNKKNSNLWKYLKEPVFRYRIYDDVLDLIDTLSKKEALNESILTDYFGNDWNYLVGLYYTNNDKPNEAIKYFKKLTNNDIFFINALYELALIYLKQNDIKNVKNAFQVIAESNTQNVKKLKASALKELKHYALLNLGRLEYEEKNYIQALRYFRSIPKNSYLFYDALYNQAWALFMEGYPNHALGALHAVDSPFFKERYNPESPILRSLIYYWICQYEEAKGALADFVENYSEDITQLTKYISYSNLSWKEGYSLFDKTIGQSSIKNLEGISARLMKEILISDVVFPIRQELGTILEEHLRFLSQKNFFDSTRSFAFFQKIYTQIITYYQKKLGSIIVDEIKLKEQEYKKLLYQANFLYVELLMSEKAQSEGEELHSQTKLLDPKTNEKIKGWAKYPMPWKASVIDEYWWDEMGFYIYTVTPNCNLLDSKKGEQPNEKDKK